MLHCGHSQENPILTIPRNVVEDKSGGGDHLDVITIDVVDGNVKTRFFVDLHMNRERVTMHIATNVKERSEERRVGQERRSRWSPYH